MTELSRQLRDGDRLHPAELAVPDIALDLIRQRVSKLDAGVREVLAAAAVIGRTFELGLLQMVTGLDSRTLMKSLDEAIAADLVVAAPDSNTAFAFGHDLMRAVLYDALSPIGAAALAHTRRRWRWKSVPRPRRPSPRASSPSTCTRALSESDLRKTVKYCRLAASHAAHVIAPSDVVRYLRHALQALALMERPSPRLRLGMSYVITIYGRGQPSTEYVRWISEVLRLAREQEDSVTLLRTSLLLTPLSRPQADRGRACAREHAAAAPGRPGRRQSIGLSGAAAPHLTVTAPSRAGASSRKPRRSPTRRPRAQRATCCWSPGSPSAAGPRTRPRPRLASRSSRSFTAATRPNRWR